MGIFAISDLHLSFGANKPMNIFRGWDNYTDRIRANWNRMVKSSDTVILPGDLSWALKIEDALLDFEFLEKLPGTKIILKGNHDLWWPTMTKLNDFLDKNDFKTIKPLFNNAIIAENYAVCGTRGWFFDSEDKNAKIISREAARLETSIKEGIKTGKELLVFLHYPPAYSGQACSEMLYVLKKYEIERVFYGHIHGAGCHNAIDRFDGIKLNLISCDCIDFTPFCIV
ncbi:MAG: metallophosphoesterase [Oscillospiraceae bacterium]